MALGPRALQAAVGVPDQALAGQCHQYVVATERRFAADALEQHGISFGKAIV